MRTGTVTASPEYGPGESHDADPDGKWWSNGLNESCVMGLQIIYSEGQSVSTCKYPAGAALVDTIWVKGSGTASSTGGIPDPWGYCADKDCYNYSGSHSVSIRTLERPDLKLSATPVHVKADDPVTFTASLSLENISPRRWQVKSYYYEPDPSTGQPASTLTTLTSTTWSKSIRWSGRMAVIAVVDGKTDTAWASVTVEEPPHITIRTSVNGVSPIYGVKKGTNITYQVQISSDSANWWPKLWVKTWTAEPIPGGNVTWSGSGGQTKHTGPASYSMTVRVQIYVAGRPRDAHVNIRVVADCAINDSVLDNTRVRDSLRVWWSRTNWSSADRSARIELPLLFKQDTTTLDIVGEPQDNFWPVASQRPCASVLRVPRPMPYPWKAIGDAHPHVFASDELVPSGCIPGTEGQTEEDFGGTEPSDEDMKNHVRSPLPGDMIIVSRDSVIIVDKRANMRRFARVSGPSCQTGQIAF